MAAVAEGADGGGSESVSSGSIAGGGGGAETGAFTGSGLTAAGRAAGIAERSDRLAVEAFYKSVAHAAEFFAPHGIDVVIEPINSRNVPGYFLNDFAFAADLIAELARPNLRLQFDIYHRQIIRGDVIKGMQALFPLIGHVQIAGVPARNEPTTGELDDIRVLKELDALGYQGFVGCEYRPANGTVAESSRFLTSSPINICAPEAIDRVSALIPASAA